MDIRLEARLMAFLLISYKDYNNPNFSFAMQNLKNNEHCRLRKHLGKYAIIDNTDLNYDVCESFKIKFNKMMIYLFISLVGPYFFMIDKKGKTLNSNDENDKITELIAEMGKFKLTILNREQLLHNLPISIECADGEKHSSVLKLFFAPGLYVQ